MAMESPPFPDNAETLVVAYYASAEVGCFLSLGWPVPARLLDLFAEFRCRTAGLTVPAGSGLLGALTWYGLDVMSAVEKDEMRKLVMRGGPWSPNEQQALLAYCSEDVDALVRLLPWMLPDIDLPRALLRGRYMTAAAGIEWTGVPIDVPMLSRLRDNWTLIQDRLIVSIDQDYGVYEGRTFKIDRWAAWLASRQIPWPLLESGALALDENTFKDMARSYPAVAPIQQLRVSLSQMRLADLAVGTDGRNRCLLSAFQAMTGRNQPSTSRFIFGPAVWLRGLIRPSPDRFVAYVDWSQQEFGIAAALSRDPAMMQAYSTGDPYLAFGKQSGQIPPDGTKKSHGAIRELFKQCVLGVQYGMGEQSLARRIGKPVALARDLLRLHHETYPIFWKWSDAAVDHAMIHGYLHTVFGWTVRIGREANPRSLRNFPMQANGAEMLRLACCLATEAGIEVCAPVHDAILIEGPADRAAKLVAQTQELMRQSSEIVLSGFSLRSDAKVVIAPDRYMDERGQQMWDRVVGLLEPPTTGQVGRPLVDVYPPMGGHPSNLISLSTSSLSTQ
jgi:hypothetical protein